MFIKYVLTDFEHHTLNEKYLTHLFDEQDSLIFDDLNLSTSTSTRTAVYKDNTFL